MKSNRTPLYVHIRRGLGAALAVSLAASALPVMAQDQDAGAEDEMLLEEVIVTGSRIVRDGFSSSSPVAVFDEDAITLAGNASIDEFLKYVPQFTGYQMGMSTNNGSAQGQKKIDMRGLGFNRTLVLINGRRTIGDATGDGAVDINTIPEAMIERVEVLTDGASSVYGSDAIAGVVNFILHTEFEGFRLTGTWGAGTKEWDAENYGISMLGGVGSDDGNIVFSMQWTKQDELLQGQRDWAFDALYPQLQDDGTFLAVGSGSSNSRRIRVPGEGNWIYDTGLGAARPFESSDVYNYSPVNALTQPNERYQFATNGKYNFNDDTRAYFSAMYTHRFAQQRLAPDASFAVRSDIETPNNGFQWNDYVPANNPYNPFGSVNCSNPLDLCDIGVRINRRFEESGGRLFADSADTYRMVFGIEGELKDLFRWDVSYIWAENKTIEETKNYGRFDRWAIAVDPVACASSDACPGVLNPFDDFGGITPEQMAYLSTGSLKDIYESSLQMIELNFTGNFGNMGGGAIGWAAGYAHRREEGSFSPDEFVSEGLTTGGAGDPLTGRFTADEFYGEIFMPILNNLSMDASFRYSDYSSVPDTELTWKLGIDWEAFDGFRIRATAGTGFRAPNISELNTSAAGGFPLVANPCEFGDRALAAGEISQTTWDNCQALGADTADSGELGFAWQSYYEYTSAGQLDPETSKTYTVGFVWDANFTDNLQFSMDYWNIEVDDVIGVANFNGLFNGCLASENLSSPACDVFDPIYYPSINVAGDAYGQFGNLGTLKTDGIDFAISYDQGFFRTNLDATWTNSYESGNAVGDVQVEQAGTADNFAVFPEWRATIRAGFYGPAWTADVVARWLDKAEDLWKGPASTADAVAESMLYIDLVGSYQWNNLSITGGVNNIFDEDPPYFHSAFNANTEPGIYDVIGRRLFVSLTAEW